MIKNPYQVNPYNEFMIFDIMWVLFPLVSFLFNYIQLYFFKSSIEFLLVTDGVHLVFHNLIANYCTKQHAKYLSAFARLCGIFYNKHTLAAFMVGAWSSICHCQYHSFT